MHAWAPNGVSVLPSLPEAPSGENEVANSQETRKFAENKNTENVLLRESNLSTPITPSGVNQSINHFASKPITKLSTVRICLARYFLGSLAALDGLFESATLRSSRSSLLTPACLGKPAGGSHW